MANKSSIDELTKLVNQNRFDIEDVIDNIVEKSDAYSVIQTVSIQKVMSEVSNNDKQSNAFRNFEKVVSETEKAGANIEGARLALYNDYEDLFEKLPVVENAINTYIDNIVSPDNLYNDFLKISHKFSTNEIGPIKKITSGCKTISEHINIEQLAEDFAFNMLLYGDAFAYIEESQTILAKKKYKVLLDSQDAKESNSTILCESMSDSKAHVNILSSELDNYSHEIILDLKNSNKDKIKLESYTITKMDYQINQMISEKDVLEIPDYAALLESSDEGSVEKIKSELLEELKLSQVKVVTPSPKNVICIYAGREILGYLILDIKEGSDGSASAGEDIGTRILDSIFNTANLKNVKEVIDDNPNFSTYLTNLLKTYDNNISKISSKFIPKHLMTHVSNRSGSIKKNKAAGTGFPYGKSHLYSIRELGKYSIISQRANMLYRFMRAPEMRIFKIDIGMDTDAAKYIQNVKREINQRQYAIDPNLDVETMSQNLTQFDTLWVPTKQGQEFFTVDQTPAGDLNSRTDDLKGQNDQIISGLRTPPIYLGLERPEDSRYTLSQMNAQFAMSCMRYQKHINQGIEHTIKNIYVMVFGNTPLLNSIDIGLQPPTSLLTERMNEVFTNVSSIGQSLQTLKIPTATIRSKFIPWISAEDIALGEIEENINKLKATDESDMDSGGGLF